MGDQKNRNTPLCLSITTHHTAVNESVPNSEYHGSGMHLSNGIFLLDIFFDSRFLMQSESTRTENGFLAPAMQQNNRWLRRRG